MKTFILFFLTSVVCLSQHTEKFKELTDVIKKDSIRKDTTYYGNGKIHYLNETSFYSEKDFDLKGFTGQSKLFYRSGVLAREDIRDNFGLWLTSKYYNRKGILTKEWITTELDTSAKNLDDFFSSSNHIDVRRTIKHYKFSKKNNAFYAYKIEYLTVISNIDGGKIDFLNEDGKIIRTKKLKEKPHKNMW
ncbi:hypothetical protein [Maribacter sp. Asnod2-G09]|uniref:hypothetical protein n=1 Tax=Maribacter sp. Asnod2-G09 TaxID=3160577 RepID=UPI00386A54B7